MSKLIRRILIVTTLHFTLSLASGFGLLNAQKTVVTIGPSVNFNPNFGLNKMLRDFNDLSTTTEKFTLKTYSFGVSGTIESQFEGGYVSWFNFHYEGSKNDAFAEDSLQSFDFHYYRVFTSFGVLNVTRQGSSGWFLKLEPLCFGRQKMKLKVVNTHKNNGVVVDNDIEAIWTTTLIPHWTPGIGIGKDMGLLRVYLGARTCVPRTPQTLAGSLGLNSANYSSRVAYFSLALHVQMKIGGN